MILMFFFFLIWVDLIGLFFYWPHFISFGSFERYVGISWERKGILVFCLVFSLEYEKQVKKS